MKTKSKKSQTVKKLTAVLVAVLIMSTALCGCGSTNAISVAKEAAQAYVDGDAAAYYELLAPVYTEYMVGDGGWYDTADEFMEDVIQDDMDELKEKFIDRCGENYSVEVSLAGIEAIEDEETFEKVQKELIGDYNYEEGDIKKAAEVEIRFRCTGNDTGGDLYHTYHCVKTDGGWYIHRPEIDALS